MEIKVKYQIGQEVWVITGDKIKEVFITTITVTVNENLHQKITYTIRYDKNKHSNYPEEKLFATKEELIKSL